MKEKNTVINNPLWDTKRSIEERLDYLVCELTFEEKLSCLGTGNPAIERLGIPAFFVGCEGAHGLQMRHDQSFDKGEPQPTTIFSNPIGMSATWDPELIYKAGEIVGNEARAVFEKDGRKGGLCLWAPTIDMERDPRWGRTEEAYGEDPYLTGKMASAYIRGMRGEDEKIRCGATLKHFYANNVEDGRVWKSSSIDPRNKYEYYLEPFRRAVTEGGAEAMMTSYNEINGVPAILNHEVQRIAKEEWGIHHVVCDGGDMKQTVDCHHYFGSHTETIAEGLKAGIDCFTDDITDVIEGAREAYELGMISMADIDRALKCHFSTLLRLGLFDPQDTQQQYGLNLPEYQDTAREIAAESVVLLKNEETEGKRLLPVDKNVVTAERKIAVIGPSADEWFLDWYSGIPPYSVTPLQGIRNVISDPENVIFESGVPKIKIACGDKYLGLLEDGETLGLVEEEQAEIFEAVLWDKEQLTLKAESNGRFLTAFDGCDEDKVYRGGIFKASAERAFGWFVKEVFHAQINITELAEPQEKSLSLAIGSHFRKIIENGEEFWLKAWNNGDLYVDEQNRIRVKDNGGFAENGEVRRIVSYTDINGHRIFTNGSGGDRSNGTYETITGNTYKTLPPLCPVLVKDGIGAARETARKADVVIYVGGAHPMITCKEEVDRKDIDFPIYQRQLLQDVYKENPRLICTLISNVPYAINWEQQNLPAILVMAGGSMELGNGLADILFGRTAPAGRLNMTWYKDTQQLPDMDDYDIIQNERTYQYFKGDVLYPFGYGLTYVPTHIGGLNVTVDDKQEYITVECTVKNNGDSEDGILAQDEVVQVYYTKNMPVVKRPVRTLAAFERVKGLRPKEERKIHFRIPVEELFYYDTIQRKKLLEPGEYEIQVAHSSRDIDCTAVISLKGQDRGYRNGALWQPADHYDRSRNGYLWEGHMGYNSVAHRADDHVPDDLIENTGGLWQNINEVTRHDRIQEQPDDCLILEYDCVHRPEGAGMLVLDADALPESTVDVFINGEHNISYVVPGFDDLSEVGENIGWAAADTALNAAHGRIFRQLMIPVEDSAEEEFTLRLRCQGDIKICRWKFAKENVTG